jgi:hypothetical protein
VLAPGPSPSAEAFLPVWQELVQVASFLEVHRALAAQSCLRAAGIHAVVPDQHYAGVRWDHAFALGGIRVCVPNDQVEAARKILAGIDPAEVDRVAEASRHADKVCPGCGSVSVHEIVRGRVPTLLAVLLLGIPRLFERRSFICESCGSDYTP